MFVANGLMKYPTKTIVEDLLTRDDKANENSYCHVDGLQKLIPTFLGNSDLVPLLTLNEIKKLRDVNIDVIVDKVQVDSSDISFLENKGEVRKNTYTKLTDVEPEKIKQYVSWEVDRWSKSDNDATRLKREDRDTLVYYDDETGEYVPESSLLEKEDSELSSEFLSEARYKLISYIKELEMYSSSNEINMNLMGILCAVLRYKKTLPEGGSKTIADMSIKDFAVNSKDEDEVNRLSIRNYSSTGVNGSIRDFNSNQGGIPKVKKVIDSVLMLDRVGTKEGRNCEPYVVTMRKLVDLCEVLGVDLAADKNPNRFDREYINKFKTNYIRSKKEFIEDFGMANRDIYNLIVGDIDNSLETEYEYTQQDILFSNFATLDIDKYRWRDRRDLMIQVFRHYLEKNDTPLEDKLRRYKMISGFFGMPSVDDPLDVSMSLFVPSKVDSRYDSFDDANFRFALHMSGNLVKVYNRALSEKENDLARKGVYWFIDGTNFLTGVFDEELLRIFEK